MRDRDFANVGHRCSASFRRSLAFGRAAPASASVAAITVVFLCCCAETPIDALTFIGTDGFDGGAGGSSIAGSASGGSSAGAPAQGGGPMGGRRASGGASMGGNSDGGVPAEGETAGEPNCSSPRPGVGVFGVRSASNALCLHAGEETPLSAPVPQEIAYRVGMTEDCSGHDEWALTTDPFFPGSFIFRSREVSDRYLDIEFGRSENGTRVILYVPAPSSGPILHQRFYYKQRASGLFEIKPGHALSKCLTVTADGLQIWPCADNLTVQEWEFLPAACADTPTP